MSKTTVLYDTHVALKGKMVEFGGYLLPVHYELGIIGEHNKVRTDAGLFDVSHMAEIHISGEGFLDFINHLLSNDFTNMKPGQIKYTMMLNEAGNIIDDLLVYFDQDGVMLVCNAGNHEKDIAWILQQAPDHIKVEDRSEQTGLLALQGPKSVEIIERFVKKEDLPAKYYTFKKDVAFEEMSVLISRTGYTGEEGFEIYCNVNDTVKIWELIMATGLVTPAGLGSRDTLRLEAGMPLYGHEMSESINPFETDLGFFVKMQKEDFIGKKALTEKEIKTTRIGLKLIDRGIAREGAEIFVDDQKIGVVTSGSPLPYVGYAGAMALVDKKYRTIGQQVIINVRGRKLKAEIIKLPFYKR